MEALGACAACAAPLPVAARFCGACGARQAEHRVAAWLDAVTLREFRAGEHGLMRVRVRNEGTDVASVRVTCLTAAAPDVEEAAGGSLAPNAEGVIGLRLRPHTAGIYPLRLVVALVHAGGDVAFHSDELTFRVAAAAALQQSIHIDARNQRVGIFENIGNAAQGGLVGAVEWESVALKRGPAPVAAGPAARLAPVGHRGSGVVVSGGDTVIVALDGVHGTLVELDDPGLRAILGPGDRLAVTVIGHDGRGGLVLSTRAAAPAIAPAPTGADLRIGPGDDLRAAIAAAPDGARFVIRGTHTGPFVADRRLELRGEDGVLEAARGPVLRLGADAIVSGLTIRGAAPAGAYAVDAVEVRSGRTLLQGCTLRSDAPGNLTPGRAVVIAGRATVEVRGCTISGCGVGVAVDVNWSGFATDTAAGARLRVIDSTLSDVGIGVALAGAGREAHIQGTSFARARDGAVRVLRGASATVEDCTLPKGSATAEPGATLIERGSRT